MPLLRAGLVCDPSGLWFAQVSSLGRGAVKTSPPRTVLTTAGLQAVASHGSPVSAGPPGIQELSLQVPQACRASADSNRHKGVPASPQLPSPGTIGSTPRARVVCLTSYPHGRWWVLAECPEI